MKKKVVEILANRLHQPSFLQENEIDVNLSELGNSTLREIQVFLENPVVATLEGELPEIEKKLTEIESYHIKIRNKPAAQVFS